MIMRTLIAIGATAAVSLLAAAPVAATFPGANGRIVFENQWKGGVWTMRPDGSDLQRLQPGSAPSWSANGRWIVYVCFPENETYDQVCMMRGRRLERPSDHARRPPCVRPFVLPRRRESHLLSRGIAFRPRRPVHDQHRWLA